MMELFAMKGDNVAQDALSSIQYQPAKRGDVTAAVAAVHGVIAERHGFDPSLTDAFEEWNTIHTQQMIAAIFNGMDIFLGSVGLVTLGLGAVGIINIMLVSVTERTREIGVMKAVGATRRSILAQFFWEGLLLTGISGLIGVGLSGAFMALLQETSNGQDARLGSTAPGALVRCAGGGIAGHLRHRRGALSGEQSRGARSDRSAAQGVRRQGARERGSKKLKPC